jgi:oligoendopeptidase F
MNTAQTTIQSTNQLDELANQLRAHSAIKTHIEIPFQLTNTQIRTLIEESTSLIADSAISAELKTYWELLILNKQNNLMHYAALMVTGHIVQTANQELYNECAAFLMEIDDILVGLHDSTLEKHRVITDLIEENKCLLTTQKSVLKRLKKARKEMPFSS